MTDTSTTKKVTSDPILPAVDWVGHSVSLIAPIDPFKVKDVLESTENHRLIQPDWTSEESGQVPGSGTTYRIPANVKAELTGVKTYYHDLQIETGTSLASKLSVSASMGVSYMGVSVNASAEYEYETTFQTDSYYGVCSMEQQVYSASLRPGAHTWNNIDPNLISRIERLPAWNEKDPAVRQDWRKFFDVYGTHIIIETFYGNSYKMRVTSTETSSLQRERWKACIEAEFLGIVKSTVEVATEEEKKTYKKSRERSVSVEGGAPQQSAQLVEDPANQAKYEAWTNTLIPGVNDNITNIKVKSLYNLLEESDHDSHRAAAAKIKDALKYFLSLLYVEWEFKCGYGSSETPIPAFDKAAVSFMLDSDDIGTRIIRPNSEYEMKFWYDNPAKPRTMHMEQTQSPGGLGSIHAFFFVETPRRPIKILVHVDRFYKEPSGYWARLKSKMTNTKITLYSPDAFFWTPELQSIKQPGNWRSGM
ncbi:MAC/Perforin domain-containing protein [Aspergillus parasiticus]|uniref:MAC/Perforin domain-containing protein n=1 Tax=Aspergillus parasiticus TaxID=5067 RepID=A0A5N6D2V9_ASPPA|nr:MAC/Perforin domain-containing protein [Aspergillus parasiticus]